MAEKAAVLPQELAELGVEMRVVRLEPGDTIVITTLRRLTQADVQDIRDRVIAFFGEYEVAVLEDGMQMQVIRRDGEPK